MAAYTTQVRSYLETLYGLKENAGYNSIEDIIAGTYKKVFTKNVPFYNDNELDRIKQAILYHYYMREIGQETAALWCYEMNKTLSEIAPYYSKMYESAELKYNPLYDVDYVREGVKADESKDTSDRTEKTQETLNDETSRDGSGTEKTQTNGGTTSKDRYSDTPQNGLTSVEDNQYLTTYEAIDTTNKQDASTTKTEKESGQSSRETETALTGNEKRIGESSGTWRERIQGKQSSVSYAKMIEELRNSFLRLDEQIIAEFESCFFQLV